MSASSSFSSIFSNNLNNTPNTLTENGALAYSTTSSFILDYFGNICRSDKMYTSEVSARILDLLPKMWKENPLLTLKAIFQKRDTREGSGEKAIFYESINWVRENHFEDFLTNIEHIPVFGYWKDYLSLVNFANSNLENDNSKYLNIISKIFAEQLQKDITALNSEDPLEIKNISLCAKWAPSLRGEHDHKFNVCKKIAYKIPFITQGLLHKNSSYDEFRSPQSLNKNNKNWQKIYRKMLAKLRDHLNIVERNMCLDLWNKIKFEQVPSVAMHQYKKTFQKHLPTEFNEWVSRVKKGESKVNVSQLMPHQLIEEIEKSYLRYSNSKIQQNDLLQAQWDAIRENSKKSGSFNKTLCISDCSGSMSGIPMQVSIALGILISELSEGSFKDLLITFSENPSFFKFKTKTLVEKYREIHTSGSIGYSTNLEKTFNIILQRCLDNKVKPEDMPTKIFLLTDGQFDPQTGGSDLTIFQNAKKAFEALGYQLPTIIFWNLRTTADPKIPVSSHETGCIMVSGWSQNILKSILSALDICKLPTPYECMLEVLNIPRYDILKLSPNSCSCEDCIPSSCKEEENEKVCKDGKCSIEGSGIRRTTNSCGAILEDVFIKDKISEENEMMEKFKNFLPTAMPILLDFLKQMKKN
jgi:hypothetical protein